MHRGMRRTCLVVVLLGLGASVGHADPSIVRDRRDNSRVGATVGLFTPIGIVGVEYVQAVSSILEVGVGAGVGFVRVGPQVAVMPRLRTRRGPFTLSFGAGLSTGRYDNVSPFAVDNAPHILSLYGNAEGSIQVASRRGPFARFTLGVGRVLAHERIDTSSQTVMNQFEPLPYGGFTVGWLL